ncbi:BnaC02g16880D [Brassica napus]|uniref:BnaC02g16880D protein n=1 Tax=Brassica napus TaxID=3708 RepID=A0A078IKR9_BRANA|nr:BnaC02g16880D [Brassica napus]
MIISNHLYDVLHIDQTSKTLKLAKAELRGSFCTDTFTITTLSSEIFELSPTSQSLTVFYFTINVPKSYIPEEKELNLKHLENALTAKIDKEVVQFLVCIKRKQITNSFNMKQIMSYLSTSSMVLFFIFFLFHHLPCASSKQELGRCETLFQCGSITVGFPFWGGNRDKLCGYPSLELHCNKDITSLPFSDQEFCVLQINQSSNTLRLARTDHMGSFCSSNFTNTTLPPNLFKLSSTYKSVTVLYNCNPFGLHLSGYKCPEIGSIFVSDKPGTYNFCPGGFTANVPRSFVTKRKDLADLESILKKGFEVKFSVTLSTQFLCLSFSPSISLNNFLFSSQHKTKPKDTLAIFECGNITAGFPFLGGSRPQYCGHPSLELYCFKNSTSIVISNHLYDSLTVFYLCDHNFRYSSSYTCPDRGPVSVSQNLDYHKSCQDSFKINLPKSYVPEEKKLELERF